jgi:hypothetical protein
MLVPAAVRQEETVNSGGAIWEKKPHTGKLILLRKLSDEEGWAKFSKKYLRIYCLLIP